ADRCGRGPWGERPGPRGEAPRRLHDVPAVGRCLFIAGLCAALASGAQAGQGSRRATPAPITPGGPGQASAMPPTACLVVAPPPCFRLTGSAATAAWAATVTGPPRLAYSIAIHFGEQGDATSRKVRAARTLTLGYELYQDAERRIVWGDRGFANTYPRGEV